MSILEELKSLFNTVFPGELSVDNVTEASRLREDVGMNSISLLYMAMVLEEKYQLQFTNEDFMNLNTVADVIKKIESR